MKKLISIISIILLIKYSFAKIPAFYGRETFEYAMDRFKNNDFYRAITEFKRYIFFGKDNFLRKKSEFMIGNCYLEGGEYKNAKNLFQIIAEDTQHPFSEEALLRLGDVEFLSGNKRIKIHKYYDFEPVYFDTIYYSRYLRIYSDARHYSEAYTKLVFLNLLNFNIYKCYELINNINNSKINRKHKVIIEELKHQLKKASDIPEKSKTFAILISVLIPGAGQIYAGEIKEGIIALLVNTAFIAGAIYTYTNYSRLLGIIIGYYELSFYFGNISNAGNAVEKFNENAKNRFRKALINIYYKRF